MCNNAQLSSINSGAVLLLPTYQKMKWNNKVPCYLGRVDRHILPRLVFFALHCPLNDPYKRRTFSYIAKEFARRVFEKHLLPIQSGMAPNFTSIPSLASRALTPRAPDALLSEAIIACLARGLSPL